MFFPISDDDRKLDGPAYVTWALLAINIVVFLYQMAVPEFTYAWSIIPYEMTTGEDLDETLILETGGQQIVIPHQPGPPIIYLTLFSSMFMHGGFGHLIGNMLYLWILGDNVEHRFGHFWFLIFYLTSGLVASLAQIMFTPDSIIPNLGASGAIAGVLGAYMVLFPRNKVNVIFFYMIVSIPAIYVLGLWAVTQIFNTYGSMFVSSQTGGVAYMAHVGGLAAGVAMGFIARVTIKEEPDSILYRQYREDPAARRLW